MPLFRRGQPPEALSAAITGVKLGDRVLFAGTDDVGLVTELATRAGLSGRVVLIALDDIQARDRAARVERGGGLVEPLAGALEALPLDAGAFDVAVTEETLMALAEEARQNAIATLFRALRPGGRLLWIERHARGGLFAKPAPDTSSREQTLTAIGFRGVRTLAAAQGRTYVEGIKAAISAEARQVAAAVDGDRLTGDPSRLLRQ